MKLSEEQASALITNVALASIHHDEDVALIDEGKTAYAEVLWAMEAVADAALTDEERDELRVLCGRAIVDPTAYRGDFLDRVLSSPPDSPIHAA